MTAVGNGLFQLNETSYTVRLTFVEGATTEIDVIELYMAVPVERRTWGAVKQIYAD